MLAANTLILGSAFVLLVCFSEVLGTVNVYSPSTWEAEAERALVPSQSKPVQQRETQFGEKCKNEKAEETMFDFIFPFLVFWGEGFV